MKRYAMYTLMMIICTGCGGWNPPDPDPQPDNTAPVIQVLGAKNIQLLHGSDYADSGATATDAEDGDLTKEIVVTGLPVPTSSAGEYVIQYRVTDKDGASVSEERQVVVAENVSPTISLIGPDTLSIEQGEAYSEPGATADDVEDGDISSQIQISGSVDSSVPGEYPITYRVEDSAGADAEDIRTVTVTAKASPFAHIPVTLEKDGFTTLMPAPDSRLVYVSSSSGDDANDGLTTETPVKTVARGKNLLRNGSPDWLLLKIGDQWQEGLGKWIKSGRSPQEPMVVTSYGEGTKRPLLMSGSSDGLRTSGGGGSPKVIDNLVFSGLHLYAQTRDPDSDTFTAASGNRGINWYRGTNYLLVEDNYIEHYKEGIQIHDLDDLNVSGVVIRKNVIVDSFSSSAHAQGIFVSETEGVVIEDNIFDHNGWHDTFPGAEATKFNHSIYIQGNNVDITIKNNIISRSSSHGMQLRPGGLIQGNFLIRNPISILLGRSDVNESDGRVIDNIVLNGTDISPGDGQRGWGIDFNPQNNGVVENNIVAHVISSAGNRFAIKQSGSVTYNNNIVYKWDAGTDDPKNYLDPERTIEEYDQLMGGAGTFESFVEKIRSQSRISWDPDYSLEKISQFFRDGFSESSP